MPAHTGNQHRPPARRTFNGADAPQRTTCQKSASTSVKHYGRHRPDR
jgi:hypothetical protein